MCACADVGTIAFYRHLKLDTRCVLAINHVFDILLAFSASNDWRQALLTAIPGRKGVHVLDDNDDDTHNKCDNCDDDFKTVPL